MDRGCEGTLTDSDLAGVIRSGAELTVERSGYAKKQDIRLQPLRTVDGCVSRVKEFLSHLRLDGF
jgi:hypothetical protein